MPRIHIDLPQSFRFATDLPVLYSHLNTANHLDAAQLLGLVAEARERFFTSLGWPLGRIEGLGIVLSDTAVQYRGEAFHGDMLTVLLDACEFNRYGCDFVWCIREKASGREIARGKTGIVFFDYTARKIAPAPAPFRARFGAAP